MAVFLRVQLEPVDFLFTCSRKSSALNASALKYLKRGDFGTWKN